LIPVVARTLRPVFVPVDEQPHGNVMNIERSSPGSAVANATILDEANNRQDVAPSFSARAWPRRAPASTHFELGKSADPASVVSTTHRKCPQRSGRSVVTVRCARIRTTLAPARAVTP
jgi:hypothetical protein